MRPIAGSMGKISKCFDSDIPQWEATKQETADTSDRDVESEGSMSEETEAKSVDLDEVGS